MSRRKDGQRFRLFVEPDLEAGVALPAPLTGAFSRPICVMSKRKPGDRVPITGAGRPPVLPSAPSPPPSITPTLPPSSIAGVSCSSPGLPLASGSTSEVVKMFKTLTAQIGTLAQSLVTVQEQLDKQVRRVGVS